MRPSSSRPSSFIGIDRIAARVRGHRTEARTKRMKTRRGARFGQLGHGARVSSRERRARRAAVGQQRRAHRGDARRAAPTRCTCPTSCFRRGCAPTASLEEALAARGHRRRRGAVARHARRHPSGGAVHSAPGAHRQRDEGDRAGHAAARVGGHRAGVRGARPVAVLSGPSFAAEVARGLPTAVSVACADPVLAEDVQREFRAPYFRLYGTTTSSASRSAAR